MAERLIFLDTQIYLHFQPVEDLPWCELSECSSVEVRVPRIVLRELDKQKNVHPSSRIRDRARRRLQRLESWLRDGPTELRPGVRISYHDLVPTEFAEYQLDQNWPDDILLAAVVALAEHGPTAILVSDDVGVRIKAGQLGIETLTLPDSARLPVEADAGEEEIRRLKAEITRLSARVPKLSLTFPTDEPHVGLTIPGPPSDRGDLIEDEMRRARERVPIHLTREVQHAYGHLVGISATDWKAYNERVHEYYEAYRRYLEEAMEQLLESRRRFQVSLRIRNDGTCPADDIDVDILFPDGFELIDCDDRPTLPDPPRPPSKPKTLAERLSGGFTLPEHILDPPYIGDFGALAPSNVSGPTIREGNSYEVHFSVNRVKHNMWETLGCLELFFDESSEINSFEAQYRINAANAPTDAEGSLRFVFRSVGSSE